ncbi:MAG TPA: HdeD family acid-resistance protein [Candidatus Binatia bacterium]|nr:HdeD family acid-resistance protein [Candidatus Binatia bacterium]
MQAPFINVDTLTRNWWVVLIRGVAGVLFGIATFFAPGVSLAVLVFLFGAYALIDGVLAVTSAVRRRGVSDRWWMLLLEGLVGIVAGIVTLVWPGITALALLYVIAAWALLTGAFEIAAAIRLRKVITGEWLLVLSGIASIGLGILLLIFPGPGALVMVLWIGAYAFVFGILLIALSLRLRSLGKSRTPHAARAA